MEFLTRAGCHLCEQARPVVHRAARRAGAPVREIDIDVDDALTRDYGMRIPVVRVDGVVLAEGAVDATALWWRLVVMRLRGLVSRRG